MRGWWRGFGRSRVCSFAPCVSHHCRFSSISGFTSKTSNGPDGKSRNILHTLHPLLPRSRPLPALLPTPNKHMPLLRHTPLHPHKLIKFQYPPLAACPALGPLMENGVSGVKNAFLSLPRRSRSRCRSYPTRSSPAYCIGRNGEGRVIVFGFRVLRRGFRCGGRLRLLGALGIGSGGGDGESGSRRRCFFC